MRYIHKPVEIEAIKYDGSNLEEIKNFVNDNRGIIEYRYCVGFLYMCTECWTRKVEAGDYIVKSAFGGAYPMKANEFEDEYMEEETK